MTIAADNVQLVATRDRAVAADQRLNLAVARAVQLCREGVRVRPSTSWPAPGPR